MPEPQPVPSWVDENFPPHGKCGLCGAPDARHRVLDAIASRLTAGESVESCADDYGYPVPFIERIGAEWVLPPEADGDARPADEPTEADPPDVEELQAEIGRLRDELAEKWELWRSCSGAEVYAELTPRIDKLYMQLNAKARGDDTDLEGDPIKPWNNLVALTVTATVRWIAANRWAVNEHQRCEKVDAELATANAEIDRLRALVGGRSAAPTRDEVAEGFVQVDETTRITLRRPDTAAIGAWRLGIEHGNEVERDGVWEVEWGYPDGSWAYPSDDVLAQIAALLSRSAAEPPEDPLRADIEAFIRSVEIDLPALPYEVQTWLEEELEPLRRAVRVAAEPNDKATDDG